MADRRRGPKCMVCSHTERTKIEALVASGLSMTAVAKRFDLDKSSLSRHMNGTPTAPPHVTPAEMSVYLAGTADVLKLRLIAAEQSGGVLEDFNVARSMTLKAMQEAASVKDWARYASVTGRFIEILDRIGRQTGEIMRLNPQIIDQSVHFTTVLNAPEWLGAKDRSDRVVAVPGRQGGRRGGSPWPGRTARHRGSRRCLTPLPLASPRPWRPTGVWWRARISWRRPGRGRSG